MLESSSSTDRLLPNSGQASSMGGESRNGTQRSSGTYGNTALSDLDISRERDPREQRWPGSSLQRPANTHQPASSSPQRSNRSRRIYPLNSAYTNTHAPPTESHELRVLGRPQNLPDPSTRASGRRAAVQSRSSAQTIRRHECYSASDICSGLCHAMGPTLFAVGATTVVSVGGLIATKEWGMW